MPFHMQGGINWTVCNIQYQDAVLGGYCNPTLFLHLDASLGCSIVEDSFGGKGCDDFQRITWNDQSGWGNNASMDECIGGGLPTTGTRTINCLNTLDFSCDVLDINVSGLGYICMKEREIYVVMERDVSTTQQIISSQTLNTQLRFVCTDLGQYAAAPAAYYNNCCLSVQAITTGTTEVFSFSFGTTLDSCINGIYETISPINCAGGQTAYNSIGARQRVNLPPNGAENFDGKMAEIRINNSIQSTFIRDRMRKLLSNKWEGTSHVVKKLWNPKDASNHIIHFEPARGELVTGHPSIFGVDDISNNNHYLDVGLGTGTLINDYIEFDGQQIYRDTTPDQPLLNPNGTHTVFVVMYVQDATGGDQAFNTIMRVNSDDPAATRRRPWMYISQAAGTQGGITHSYKQSNDAVALISDITEGWHIIAGRITPDDNEIWVDGELIESISNGGLTFSDTESASTVLGEEAIVIGQVNAETVKKQRIKLVAYRRFNVSESLFEKYHGWLSFRYDIPLVSGHTYENEPPYDEL